MSVSSILNLLHELNKIILCKPLASILLYLTSSINSVLNLHEFTGVIKGQIVYLNIMLRNCNNLVSMLLIVQLAVHLTTG
jgi:hypothetical protein